MLGHHRRKIVWKVSGKSFRHQPGMWGTSECPLVIDGKKVIYTPSGNETTIVALDAETGKTIWKSRSLQDEGGYASPILITYNGHRKIVALTGNRIVGGESGKWADRLDFRRSG